MKKYILIPLLFTLITPLYSSAASGDITIGTRVYTQSEATSRILTPLMKRVDRIKNTKTKQRYTQAQIRIYTSRQRLAERKGNTTLAEFYMSIIAKLTTVTDVTSSTNTGSTQIQSQSDTPLQTPVSQQTTTKNGNVTNSDGSVLNNGGTANNPNNVTGSSTLSKEDTLRVLFQRELIRAYNGNGGADQSRSIFIKYVAQQFGTSDYVTEYASTFKFDIP